MRDIDPSRPSVHPFAAFLSLPPLMIGFRAVGISGLAGIAALSLGGCAQQPAYQHAAAGRSKEYFPASIYGRPSPRVVNYGEPVPRGGGVYMVGKPYSVAGRTFYPSEKPRATIGLASWYGEAFHGRRTANGEIYDCDAITAAHPTMPLPSYARVTNLDNKNSLIVRVNDRGPFHPNRILDVSRKTAEILAIDGTARVKVEYIGPAGLAGSDDSKLLATLRTDGPAVLDAPEREASTIVASTVPEASEGRRPSTNTPLPPVRESEVESPDEPAARKSVVIASNVPLPPARPGDIGTRAISGHSSLTRVARSGN